MTTFKDVPGFSDISIPTLDASEFSKRMLNILEGKDLKSIVSKEDANKYFPERIHSFSSKLMLENARNWQQVDSKVLTLIVDKCDSFFEDEFILDLEWENVPHYMTEITSPTKCKRYSIKGDIVLLDTWDSISLHFGDFFSVIRGKEEGVSTSSSYSAGKWCSGDKGVINITGGSSSILINYFPKKKLEDLVLPYSNQAFS
jgi:hypothetical protein